MLDKEKQREMSEQARLEHEEKAKREDEDKRLKEKGKKKKLVLTLSIVFLVVLAIAVPAYLYNVRPGRYDNFAKCLAEKGAIMYGAIEWCHYTKSQAGMFGKSYKYVNYQDYRKLEDIRKTPTWVINGERHEGVQSFERLAALTGCSYS